MSHQQQPQPGQNPQQPGWGPQQPYGQPQQPGWGAPPPPPKKPSAGKIVGLGCLGIIAFFVVVGIIAGIAGSGDSDSKSSSSDGVTPAASVSESSKPTADSGKPKAVTTPKKTAQPEPKPKAKVVTFKVWGTAPAGALGPLDINYGSDSDSRGGAFKNGTFTATLPLDDDALYYNVTAQLQGSGDIQCSVTVDGETKKAHASGDYQICNAQLSGDLFGGWS